MLNPYGVAAFHEYVQDPRWDHEGLGLGRDGYQETDSLCDWPHQSNKNQNVSSQVQEATKQREGERESTLAHNTGPTHTLMHRKRQGETLKTLIHGNFPMYIYRSKIQTGFESVLDGSRYNERLSTAKSPVGELSGSSR